MTAPDPLGALLMVVAGVSWGIYSLAGRGQSAPIAATAANFARAAPGMVVLGLVAVGLGSVEWTGRGVALAATSGGLASGLGYAIWYLALRGHTATSAAIVQLAVPILAAAGGVLLLGEMVTARLVVSTVMTLGGIALAVARK